MVLLSFNGNCIDYMQRILEQSIDTILCDLPYGMAQKIIRRD